MKSATGSALFCLAIGKFSDIIGCVGGIAQLVRAVES